MGNKKNIDRLFQEKFKDFEVFPERDLWSGIEAKLDNASDEAAGIADRRKKTVPVLWWRLGGIAAAIALLLTAGLNFLPTDSADTPGDPIEKVVKDHNVPAGEKETSREKDQVTEDSDPLVSTEPADPGKEEGKATTPSQPVKTHGPASQQDRSTTANNSLAVQQDDNNDPGDVKSHGRGTQQDGNTITDTNPVVRQDSNNNTTNVKPHDRVAQQDHNTVTNNSLETRQDNTTENSKKEENKKSLLEAIAEMENETDKEKELALKQGKGTKKWSINPNVAPVYYNSLSGGSPIDPEFKSNSKSGEVNLSYGVNVAYQVSNRVSLRSGINRVNYGYNTNDISFAPDFEARALNNINYSPKSDKAGGLYVANANDAPPTPAREEVASSFAPQEGLMLQEFGYIEVPMEVKYRIVDQRLGLNLIGGLSSLFLTDNSVLLKSESLATELGEANNINSVNFSTNVGVGVDYLLLDKLLLQVEPMFKYQLNTFSDDNGGFRPYSFGVYTGFSFRF